MSKKIIVFGATGNLGAYISTDLQSRGYDVVAVAHRKSDNGFFADNGMPYYSVDVSRKEDFAQLPQSGVYAVIHFAGAMPSSMHGYDATRYIQSIVQGTYNVLEYARTSGADRILFPQSLFDVLHLFGSPEPIPAEPTRVAPLEGDHAMYVISKNAAVDMIDHYYHTYGLKRFVFRLSRIYLYHPNPYTCIDGKDVLVSDRRLIYKAMRGEDIEVWGDPNRVLETIAIGDFLQIIRCAIEANCDGGFYNVGSGGTTLDERVKAIVEVFSPAEHKSQIIYRPDKPNGTQFVLDYSKTERELGYHPSVSWTEYLKDFKHEMEIQRYRKIWGVESDYINPSKL